MNYNKRFIHLPTMLTYPFGYHWSNREGDNEEFRAMQLLANLNESRTINAREIDTETDLDVGECSGSQRPNREVEEEQMDEETFDLSEGELEMCRFFAHQAVYGPDYEDEANNCLVIDANE
jgi:hypothetical protein